MLVLIDSQYLWPCIVLPIVSLWMAVYSLPYSCLNQRATCFDLLHLHHVVVDSPSLTHVFPAVYFLVVLLSRTKQYLVGFFPLSPLRPSFSLPLPLLRE